MKTLSKPQADHIRDDIKSRGVTSKDLLNLLTDHVSCLVEERNFTEDNFLSVYAAVVDQFVPANFGMIQEFSNQFVTKKYMYMKIAKFTAIGLVCYATFVLILSFWLRQPQTQDGEVLKSTAFLFYGTSVLVCAYYLIRYKISNVNLRIICGLVAYACLFFFITLALKGLSPETGNTLMGVVQYVFISIAAGSLFLFWRYRRFSAV